MASPQSGPTSLAGRLKNRLRRSVHHGEAASQPSSQLGSVDAGATAAGSLQSDPETEDQHFEFVQQPAEQPPDLEDCAELSELLMAAAAEEEPPPPPASPAEQQLRAQLVSLAIENEALRERASQAETELVSRLRRQLSEERLARLRAETAAADAAAAVDKPASGGPISRAVANLRRRRRARAAAAAAAVAAAAGGTSTAAEGVAVASAVEVAELESLDSDSGADPDDDAEKVADFGRRKRSFCDRVKAWTARQLIDLMEDLQQPAEAEVSAAAAVAEEPQLSARRLKANASRFGRNARQISRCLRGLQGILRWRSPSYSALVLTIYYFALRYELLLQLLLLLGIARLSLNYLKYRLHWSFEFNFVTDYEPAEVDDAAEKERSVGTQVNLVVQVARKAQNLAGKLSDNMEKFKNLVTWRSPKHTQMLLNVLVVTFAVSLVLPSSTCLQLMGFYLGVKLFIIDPLVARYPRLRRRFDRASRIWRALPTDQQLGSLQVSRDVEKYILPPGSDEEDDTGGGGLRRKDAASAASLASSEDSPQQLQLQQFCQTFSLPAVEAPLPRWRSGKRCAIVCKDGERSLPLPSWLKHGKLFLTRSFLCFERSKDRGKARKRNLVIPLSMIRWLKKTKPFSWLPGGGMSIEVQIFGIEKPLIFGAIIGRDEVFDSLMEAGKRAGLAWAGGSAAGSESHQQQQQQPPQADPHLVQSVSRALLSDSDSE